MADMFRGEVYEEVAKGNFNFMKKYYNAEENTSLFLPYPLTNTGDTALHMAVYSETNQPLQDLLKIAEGTPQTESAYRKENMYGITPLHVAAKVGNLEAVKLLVDKDQRLIDKHDKLGETPLFKAAANGHRKVMLYLASQRGQIDGSADKKLKEIHRRRKDGYPILYMAIQGDHLGTALELVKLDKSLALEKDASGISSLQLLANLPSSFNSGYPMHLMNRIIYFCLPVISSSFPGYPHGDHDRSKVKTIGLCATFWRFLSRARPKMGKLWREKRKHEFALELAKILIEKDDSWKEPFAPLVDPTSYSPPPIDIVLEIVQDQERPSFPRETEIEIQNVEAQELPFSKNENPLFTATKNGIVEIVKEMLRVSPNVVELYNRKSQNILHITILHRRKEIFNLVKKMKVALDRLVEGIDKNGYSILHCAADIKYYTGTSRPGPAYELQDELKWFYRVEKLVPPHLAMHHEAAIDMTAIVPPHSNTKDREKKMTAKVFFDKQHQGKLKDAQEWIKQTSQSCSTVAVLVATVVFAAAYTVPGGLNESGLPHFLNSPSFLFFTVMDVVSLACSLTAVVMFLSILSSPFEINDFHYSLPRKLTIGFTLLFLSVATTTLAFASTVLLIIRLDVRNLTSTLIYTAAFLPVGILALMQFPLYVAFVESFISISKVIRKIPPFKLVRRLFYK